MRMRVLALMLVAAAVPATVSAQNVELLFTPGVYEQAVALKGALRVEKITFVSFGTLALVGATKERKKAYADQVAKDTAIVIVGEDALKAVSEIEFSIPVIPVNANGRTAAKNRVIRVFDSSSSAAPPGARAVAPTDAVKDLIAAAKDVSLKGDVGSVVQAVLASLK